MNDRKCLYCCSRNAVTFHRCRAEFGGHPVDEDVCLSCAAEREYDMREMCSIDAALCILVPAGIDAEGIGREFLCGRIAERHLNRDGSWRADTARLVSGR
jgi:hypothetical protein